MEAITDRTSACEFSISKVINFHRIHRRVSDFAKRFLCRRGFGKNTKVFGIGRNKTGTTSLEHALTFLGYRVAPTRLGENLLVDWSKGNFDSIIALCRDFDAFQDVPFSLPGCYEALDVAFPGSKFVLTVRDSEDQWFKSLTRFHSKLFGKGKIPDWDDLENASYHTKGFMALSQKLIYEAEKNGLYNEQHYKAHYRSYNASARNYFKDRPNDFLELNVGSNGAFQKLCVFLDIESEKQEFPWVNRTNQD